MTSAGGCWGRGGLLVLSGCWRVLDACAILGVRGPAGRLCAASSFVGSLVCRPRPTQRLPQRGPMSDAPPPPIPAPLPAAPLTDIEDFIPLPAYGWDIRPTTSPLDVEECATALVMACGELAGAARLLRVSELRLQRVMGRSERLRRLHGELVALLNDRVLHEVRRAFDDDDGRRREWAVAQVVKSRQFQSHPLAPAAGGDGQSVSIVAGDGNLTFVWKAQPLPSGDAEDKKLIDGTAEE